MAKTTLYQYAANAAGAQFLFADGTERSVKWEDLSADIMLRLAAHGLKQKVADGAAIPRDVETGRSATNDDKIGAMVAILQRVAAGEWNANREGGGNVGGLLLRALVEMYPAKTREQLADFLATKTDKEKAAMRGNPKVAAIIERIKLEAGRAEGIDSDELLDELA